MDTNSPGEFPIKQQISRNYNRKGLSAESSACSLHCFACSSCDNICYSKNVMKTLLKVASSDQCAMRNLKLLFTHLIRKGEPSIL